MNYPRPNFAKRYVKQVASPDRAGAIRARNLHSLFELVNLLRFTAQFEANLRRGASATNSQRS